MWKVTLTSLRAKKLRLITTALAVMLGVAFMAGTLVLTDTLGSTFDGLLANANQGTDAYVRSSSEVTNRATTVRPRITASLAQTISHVPGVAGAAGYVEGYAQIVGKDGKVLGNPSQGAPTIGASWTTIADLNPYHLVEGTAPSAPADVVIDKHTADDGHFHVGDQVTILSKSNPEVFTIAGIAKFGTADSMGGTQASLFASDTAQRLLSQPGQVDAIRVLAADGTSQAELTERIAPTLPSGTEVLTGDAITKEQQADTRKQMGFITTFLMVFADIAILVGAFIIANTFSIIVAQRSREMALLRAIGASRKQVRRSVLAEAAVVGLFASVLGLFAGLGVAAGIKGLFGAMGLEIPGGPIVVTTKTVVLALVTGIGVTVGSAWLPARRGSKVPPVAAMRAQDVEAGRGSKRRTAAGLAITGAGVAALAAGLGGSGVPMVLLGGLAVFLGIAVLGPLVARPAARVIGAPLRLRGTTGSLARENAMRNPKRTAATASALMIGVGLVAFITIFAASTKQSISGSADRKLHADYVIDSGLYDEGGLSPALTAALQAHPQFTAVTAVRNAPTLVDGRPSMLEAVDASAVGQIADLGTVTGDVTTLGADGIAVLDTTAKSHSWKLGDTIPVTFAKTGTTPFTIRAIYTDSDEWVGKQFVSTQAFDLNVSDQFDTRIFVKAAPGVSPSEARTIVDSESQGYALAKVQTFDEFKASLEQQIDQILTLVYALLGLAVIIALMGIANTLALSIFERTRELGLLRAVGMSRRQVRATIRSEAVIIAMLGTSLGLGIGMFFGWAMVHALASQGITTFVVPVSQLAVVVVIAALAGVTAAILPARRAAKLDVLAAISS
jgi:putative ABC transport system permease protein